MTKRQSIVPTTLYQKNWLNDRSRFKIGIWARQTGKSYSLSLDSSLECVETPGNLWVLLSSGERQSKELMRKVQLHCKAQGRIIRATLDDFWTEDETKYNLLEIELPNESRIIGLPGNPYTAAGYTGNVGLDEFSKQANSWEIWRALYPCILRGYRIAMLGTFKGVNNKLYQMYHEAPTKQEYIGRDLIQGNAPKGYSKHNVTLDQAVDMGLELKDPETGEPCTAQEIKDAMQDPEGAAEDFDNVAQEEASSYITHALITSVQDQKLVTMPKWAQKLVTIAERQYPEYKREGLYKRPNLPMKIFDNVEFKDGIYVGMDIARKTVTDHSVIWVSQKIDNILVTVAVIDLIKQPFFVQEQVLHTICKLKSFRRACLDETGIGMQLAENAQDLFGAKIEPITFSPKNKEHLAINLRRAMMDRQVRIPVDNVVRDSFHSVKKYVTSTLHDRFDADRTEVTGHADHFWAKALAVEAAGGKVVEIDFVSTGQRRMNNVMDSYMMR